MATPDLTNPAQNNIFAYGGNTIDARTGAVSGSVTPTISTINGNLLQPTPQINYATPNPTPVPDVSSLYATPAATLTGPEQQASDVNTRLQNLNNQLVGKSAYTTQQETAAGLPQLTAQQNDLAAQVSALANEARSIPLQFQNDAIGRGQTAAGVQPLQTAALRTNAIKALQVSSLLDATNGLIASAKDKIDRAVKAKYDPIQEQIDAATKNLQLILNSPQYSLADKNRAQQQLDAQKQKQDALDKAKQDMKDVNTVALEAAKNGADAVTLQKITQAPNQASAIQAAGSFLQTKQNNQVVTLKNGNTVVVDPTTGNVINNLGGAPPPGLDLNNLIGTPALDGATAQAVGTGKVGDILSATGLSLPVFNFFTQGTAALSRMTSADRMAIMNAASQWAKAKGVDVSTLQSQYKAYNDVLQKNIERANNTKIFADEVSGSADALMNVINPSDLGQTGGVFGIGSHSWKAGNIAALALGQQVNDPTAAKYSFQLQAMTNDLAGYFAASRGANIPENADIQDAAKVIADGLNSGSTQAFKEAIQANEQKVSKVVDDAVQRSQKNVWNLFGVGDQYQTKDATAKVGQTVSSANGLPEGTMVQGDDNKQYVVKNGQFVPQ